MDVHFLLEKLKENIWYIKANQDLDKTMELNMFVRCMQGTFEKHFRGLKGWTFILICGKYVEYPVKGMSKNTCLYV